LKNIKKNHYKTGLLFIISSPSGGGKTTIAKNVIVKLKRDFPITKVITYTSRQPRNNEVHGRDYFFISKIEFLQKVQEDFFLETTKYNGELYGSPMSIIKEIKNEKSFIIVTDRDGAKNYSKLINTAILIWIVPPSLQILKNRLIKRSTETEAEIDMRIKLAKNEIQREQNNKIFKYYIVNDGLEEAIDKISLIIIKEILS
jgi:guanylate kinase